MPNPASTSNSLDEPWEDNTPGQAYPFTPEQQAANLSRAIFWKTLGEVEKDPIIHPPSLIFGGMSWPASYPTWRIIHRPSSVLLVTDGLSNPVVDAEWIELLGGKPRPKGMGLEIVFEFELDFELDKEGDIPGCSLDLVTQVSHVFAAAADAPTILDRYGVMSVGVEVGEDFPEIYRRSDNVVGVLVGLPMQDDIPREMTTPYGNVRLVCATLLTREEFDAIDRSDDPETMRQEIAAKRMKDPRGYWSRV